MLYIVGHANCFPFCSDDLQLQKMPGSDERWELAKTPVVLLPDRWPATSFQLNMSRHVVFSSRKVER